jgi:hypothetical protein
MGAVCIPRKFRARVRDAALLAYQHSVSVVAVAARITAESTSPLAGFPHPHSSLHFRQPLRIGAQSWGEPKLDVRGGSRLWPGPLSRQFPFALAARIAGANR